jgi:NADH-quinone oxidoreductase subunit J
MTRSAVNRFASAFAFAAAVAVVLTAAASSARADDPRQRPCQASEEAAVRAALPTATAVRCPVLDPEFRIVNGQSVPLPTSVKAEAVLADGRIATVALDGSMVQSVTYNHLDTSGSTGKGMALLFWAFALIAVFGAVFVISRRNLIAAVMGMVGSFVGIAAIYMMLYAQFLAVIQMLVYAGAIMVLFVFVVMILNRPEDEPVAPSGRAGQALGALAIVYLVFRLVMMLVHVEPPNPETAMAAPQGVAVCTAWKDNSCVRSERLDWGSVGAVGTDLFNAGLFPFEAISILLLVAVVGAIAIARPLGPEDERAKQRMEGGVA